ncbi:hypothetical protein DFQ11_102599 [Winogradskyella epiphytica]|uniref:Uncharacterized protein n=1 Tax=Winogradskyella epiphytica TaxID=262005 RepID=A0A2V4X8R9_9FLAO|nr:hypothetical protein [Winogradskyella epiphytica]PYE82019.1 hypothetical protein DFQ11_102599 [Winogradskyella epiphytica]GGW61059.1 hypothetical protein GCM10008085_10750 [Winogradskyella epiphytica]
MKSGKEKFKYVYVENDGTVRELNKDEIEYLQTEFEPTDGARPYVKNSYNQLTPNKKILGFLHRSKVLKEMEIINTDLRYTEMRFPIGIYESNIAIELPVGSYSIKVLGGWSVSVGDFSIQFRNKENGKTITPRLTKWKFQSYEFGERAKKIMTLDNAERGIYYIEFKNQKKLKVKHSNLFITRLFKQELPNEKLKIWIG